MKAHALPILAILVVPALYAPAAAAPAQPRSDVNFDGSRPRPEATFVPAGPSMDGRTAEQIAQEEQAKADARAALATRSPWTMESAPPKPALEPAETIAEAAPPLGGAPASALPGLAGLAVGILLGGGIGYAMSRATA